MLPDFSFSFFPCSADHERDWSPCKVVFFGVATNALNVRNNNNSMIGYQPEKATLRWPIQLNLMKSFALTDCCVWYGHTDSKSMEQPGKVANPARGQLNRDNGLFLSPSAPENLPSRDGFGSPVPRQPACLHTHRLNLVLTCEIPAEFRGGVCWVDAINRKVNAIRFSFKNPLLICRAGKRRRKQKVCQRSPSPFTINLT